MTKPVAHAIIVLEENLLVLDDLIIDAAKEAEPLLRSMMLCELDKGKREITTALRILRTHQIEATATVVAKSKFRFKIGESAGAAA